MNKILIFVGGVVVGGAAGFVAANLLLKKKYEALVEEDVASVREMYKQKLDEMEEGLNTITEKMEANEKETESEPDPEPEPESEEDDQVERSHYEDMIKDLKYTNDIKEDQKPYLITPDEFAENEDYDYISLSYYRDGTVTDDMDVPMSEEWIKTSLGGRDFVNHFAEYNDDAVYIRNDRTKVDYEIVMEIRPYKETLHGAFHVGHN